MTRAKSKMKTCFHVPCHLVVSGTGLFFPSCNLGPLMKDTLGGGAEVLRKRSPPLEVLPRLRMPLREEACGGIGLTLLGLDILGQG